MKPERKLSREVRQVFESLFLCIGLVTVPLLPRRVVLGLAAGLGRIAFFAARRLRRITLANLDIAYGDTLSARQKRAVARGSFGTSALLALDILWFSFRVRKRVERYVHMMPSMDPFMAQAPLVGVTAHIGNWEVCGLAIALRGAPMLSVAAPLNNRFVDRMLNRTRRLTGQTVVARKGAVRAMLRELKAGGRIGLLMDQNVPPRKGGVFVDFFGLPVPVSGAAAVLSASSDAPIIVCACVSDGRGHYEIHGCPPIQGGDGEEAALTITQAMTAEIERQIRRTPEQWLWMYKRWRFVPEGVSMESYPFYRERYVSQHSDGN